MTPSISGVRFCRASEDQRELGLEGWASFDLDGRVHIDGVAIRRTRSGALTVVWPARKDTAGRLHHSVRPVDHDAREQIEAALLAALFAELREVGA